MDHSLAPKYLAKFSGVGGGNNSGVNKLAFFIFPLIFILPYKKATDGYKVPRQTFSKSASVIEKMASTPG